MLEDMNLRSPVRTLEDDAAVETPTGATSVIDAPDVPRTRTSAVRLAEDAGYLRTTARNVHEDVRDLHRWTNVNELGTRTNERARQTITDLLELLAGYGFSWRDVARISGVTVPAVQKWRRGASATGENRLKVATLVALCDALTEDHLVQDVVSWLEMPLVPGLSLTALDAAARGEFALVCEYAGTHATAEELATRIDPNWRDAVAAGSRFETVTVPGEGRVIVVKSTG